MEEFVVANASSPTSSEFSIQSRSRSSLEIQIKVPFIFVGNIFSKGRIWRRCGHFDSQGKRRDPWDGWLAGARPVGSEKQECRKVRGEGESLSMIQRNSRRIKTQGKLFSDLLAIKSFILDCKSARSTRSKLLNRSERRFAKRCSASRALA